ncbi:Uncharacterised protein [Raoultella planticola]|uniref:Uncharacterized protein n=1 Tax=Raoultella planticola TaxID=575 RepID=A0A485ALM5_RAOPL|nr:Uncharacterised protein [Raoultella planticola]
MRDPAAVHVPCRAAHLGCTFTTEKQRQFTQLFRGDKLAGGLLFRQQLFAGLVRIATFSDAFIDLLLYQRG